MWLSLVVVPEITSGDRVTGYWVQGTIQGTRY